MLRTYITGKIVEGYNVENGLTITKCRSNIFWEIYKIMHRKELIRASMNKPCKLPASATRWGTSTTRKGSK